MKIILAAVCAALIWTAAASAQSSIASGEISGTIKGPSGAVVSNARITVTSIETGLERKIESQTTGSYRVLLLPPGEYDVRAEADTFNSESRKSLRVGVGETIVANFELQAGQRVQVDVIGFFPVVEAERSHQANTIIEESIRQLPIDRRDYLTYTLLVPGVVDSTALADNNDFRVPQTRDSGLSFYGSNGRGNSVTVDGGEANDSAGGVRRTLSQEAIREFQINRGNFSAEMGGASGAAINIVSKSGTNQFHGSVYGFFRNHRFDAADPFAIDLVNNKSVRVDPPSNRQQYGATFGGPLKTDRTMFFAAFEGLRRRESNSVPVLTDVSIFEPTPDQQRILDGLPQAASTPLRTALTSSAATRSLFSSNSGVFPFSSDDYTVSARIDHQINPANQGMFRYNYTDSRESNPNTRALVGVSRGNVFDTLDHDGLLSWTHLASSRTVSQFRAQFSYRNYRVGTNDPYGPELNISGFGFFNRDFALPSDSIIRRVELSDTLSLVRGAHNFKFGGTTLIRANHNDVKVFRGGRFTFGSLPGALVSSALASATITAVQAFNLGLPQIYQQGFGDPVVASTTPFYGAFFQDSWKVAKNLTFELGVRYELDVRTKPVPKDSNNWAPRVAFAWDIGGHSKTVMRGGYGIFYSPHYFQVDYVGRALSNLNGHRQIAQVFTTIQSPGAASAANIYKTLLAQNVIRIPTANREIAATDIAQFGLIPTHDGPVPAQTALFGVAEDFVNPYSQQASLGIDHTIGNRWSIGASYLFASTAKIVRARDQNLLPAPVDPALGVRVWTAADFRQPTLLQDNVYESSGRAFYHGLVIEMTKRFSSHFSANANYTLSKAIDEVVDYNSDFQPSDQANLRGERALSSFDQRHKLVVYGTMDTGADRSGFMSVFSNLSFSPVLRANSARPFNLLAGFDLNGDRHPTTDRPAFAGRNTGVGPNFWTTDFRVTKKVSVSDQGRLEAIFEAFNVLNRLNFQSVNNTVGAMAPPFNVQGRRDRNPSQSLGFTGAYDARRIQLGLRLSF